MFSFHKHHKASIIEALWFVVFLIFPFFAHAQKEENIWIVDENYAIDFNAGTPQVFKANFGRFHPQDHDYYGITVSTICDKNGNLLFYTDGNQVWNAQRQIMPHGQLANHNPNSLLNYFDNARAVIVPNLNNANQYYVVVSDQVRELNTYSVVDMSLDGGKGDIITTQKMIPFTNGNFFYDLRATGVDSCRGIWLVGVAKNIASKIFAYKIGANGISTIPQISSINNSIVIYNNDLNVISNDGLLLIIRNRNNNEILINKFNKITGWFEFIPIKVFKLRNLSSSGINFNYVDGVVKSMSSNNQNFFLSASFDVYTQGMFNSNLFSNDDNTMLFSSSGQNFRFNFARYAPNDKIYYSIHTAIDTGLPFPYSLSITSHNLAVINNPDGVGTNVGYDFNGITFPGDAFPRVPYQGLVNYYGKPKPRPKITLPSQVVCADVPFVLSADVSSLPGVVSGLQSWQIDNGPVISYNVNDSHTINTPGVYNLSFRHEECVEYTTITVTSPITANVPPKDTLCEGEALLLTTLGSVFVTDVQNLPIQNPVSVAGAFTYTFAGCNTVSGSFELAKINKPKLQMPSSVLGCSPNVVTINPSFSTSLGQNLRWSNGSTLPVFTTTSNGLYVLTINNQCFTEIDSTEISFFEKPKINQPTIDTTVCEGQKISISANYPVYIENENNNSTTFLGISKVGNYTIHSTNECYTTTSFLNLKTDAIPRFSVPNDTIICDDTSLKINGISNPTERTKLLWSDGNIENNRIISQNGEYEFVVKNTCGEFKKAFSVTFAKSNAGFNGSNVFTPNGDNINDTWLPFATEKVNDFELKVYNRYGTMVYQTTDQTQAWNAANSPDGLYFYSISYTDCNQMIKNLKGTVMVVR